MFFLAVVALHGQGQYSNQRLLVRPVAPSILLQDSLDIIPTSVNCRCVGIADSIWFSYAARQVQIDTALLPSGCSQLEISWRVFPFALTKPLYRFDSLAWLRALDSEIPIEYDFGQTTQSSAPLWQSPGLNTSGAYTRGFALGNSQNLNFNSDLNLQMSGRLGHDVEINAAIADNTVPVQPDGSTRNIQEFDRIYVQLRRHQQSLLAGDFEIAHQPNRYFTRYFKKLQGAQVSTAHLVSERFSLQRSKPDTVFARATASISRGKFNRMVIQGAEGNQGPYRLQGAEGERFIIVLAGTEKVWIDGQLMRRGQEDDYVIDYNLGELTFTARRLITKDIRIIIEYEYVVQAYLRTLLTTETEWVSGNKRAYLSTYSEQDNPNSSGIQALSNAERLRLSTIGDSVATAFASGVDTLREGFDPNRVLYKWIDTLVCGVPGRVLAFSANRDSAILSVRWSEVPQGTGNYRLATANTNGRVYEYVAPDPVSCQPQGNYEPVTKLTAPERRQIFAVGGEIKTGKNNRYAIETALSNRDPNRLSRTDDSDNYGLGLAVSARKVWGFGKQKITFTSDYEFVQDRFKPINPYRVPEFVRDWNTETLVTPQTEHLGRAALEYRPGTKTLLSYGLARFERGDVYAGTRHLAHAETERRGLRIWADLNEQITQGVHGNSRFSRPRFEVSQALRLRQIRALTPDSPARDSADRAGQSAVPLLQVGVYGEREKNPRYAAGFTELAVSSFWYDLGRVYLRMPLQTNGLQWELTRSRRNDYAPQGAAFLASTRADELALKGGLAPKPGLLNQTLNWQATRRRLTIINTQLSPLQAQTTWLGRADYQLSAWRNAIGLNLGYEVGSGQNPKLEFTYVQVNPGEGNYTWIDRNQDSILTVDEMEIAVFRDQASYIRLAVTTNQFIQTNSVAFNQNFRFEPRLLWSKKQGVLKQLARLSAVSSWQVNRKVRDDAVGVSPWNPFEFQVSDTSLVNVTASGRQTLFFQRAHPRFESSLSQSGLRNRFVATTGFESRGQDEWTLRTRYNPQPAWTFEVLCSSRRSANDAELFNNRDYLIRDYTLAPELSWLYAQQFRSGVQYKWVQGRNSIGEQETSNRHQVNLNFTWQPKPKRTARNQTSLATSLRASATFADIRYLGTPNTPVAFVMMEGLQNGRNFLWNTGIDRQLSKSMQLNISYEGRRPGTGKVVHVGRASVRALF